MRSLHETQAAFRAAVTGGEATALLAGLRCPAEPAERLAIYRRHHRESFRRHLRGRYPTLEWLLGTDALVTLADATLRRSPPRAPSLAEYGEELIATLTAEDHGLPPWIAEAARIDWVLGGLSVAVEAPALAIAALAEVAAERLGGIRLGLQPGLHHIACTWPVDALLHLRLGGDAPDHLAFERAAVHLELTGGRGRFAVRRLAPGDFAFRAALGAGQCLGQAAEQGLAADAGFDLAAALAAIFADNLVISHSGDSHDA